MQSLGGGNRAPLGLLLICLCLPGLFARSIGAPEEKVSPHSAQPSFTSLSKSGQPQPKPGQPQPKPNPVNNELLGALRRLSESPQDGVRPEGGSEVPSGPPFWGPPPMESWPSEDPQQGIAPEDQLEPGLPEAPSYLSRAGPLPEASYPQDAEAGPQAGSAPLETEAEAFARRPFWFLNHKVQPGLSGRILSPGTSWGSGGAGTGWGTRPMPYPSGIWGSNGLVSGTSLGGNGWYPAGIWGGNGRFPAGSWGGSGQYPAGSWGGSGQYPVGSWGGNGWYPAGIWGGNGRYPGSIWGSNGRYPGSIWGSNGRYPGSIWGGNGRYPAGIWGGNGRYQAGSWGANCQYPAGSRGPNCQYPAGSWGVKGQNRLPPGDRRPGSSRNTP